MSPLQPIAVNEAAALLAEVALADPRNGIAEIASSKGHRPTELSRAIC
jgi:hypothetical protein